MWIVYALLGAVFAAFTNILAKIGIEGVDSNLATAIRTVVVLVMAWVVVLVTGVQSEIADIGRKSWIFLGLSGLATGFSWLFFYKALQMGQANKVIPIDKFSIVIVLILSAVVLKEPMDVKQIIASLLITAGTFILIF